MSRQADPTGGGTIGLGGGLGGSRQGGAFRGPVESPEAHEHANDHFALVYETEAALFSAVVPFLRAGIDAGERCVYVLEERSEATVVEALRDGGIDVDEARESGALSFSTVGETYLREAPFDPDATIAFYADAVEEARTEYEGFRVVAGTNWIEEVPIETFMEYESRVNRLFEETDSTALCHYDRDRLPPEVIYDVIRTHPHLVYDGTLCQNFYYIPPGELYGADGSGDEVDRLLDTLRDRTRAKAELAEHKRFLHEMNEVTASPDRSFEEKLQGLFDLACEWFDLELGGLNKVDPEADRFEVEYLSDDHHAFEPGVELPLSETFCQAAAGIRGAAAVADPVSEGYGDITVYEEFGARTYLGTFIPVEGGPDRTFAFVASEPRTEPFSGEDVTYIELMGQWVQYELERDRYQRELEETVDRLRQSNDRLKQFTYAASHDLQEPIRMVSSYLQLVEEDHRQDIDAEAREYIDYAVDCAERMREMVEDLLAYSRVEQSEEAFEPVDCDAVLERVAEDLRANIEESDAEVLVDPLPTVVADGDQLEQLFRNLVSNAIKYSGDGPPRVEVAADDRGDRWEFAVSDDGIGIPPEKTDHIFEVFKRLHHEDEYSGTGIGLSLCQEIVDNHGGDVRVDSTPGEGSTFSVSLPKRGRDG